jgi:DNA-binding response OmpR family regulator
VSAVPRPAARPVPRVLVVEDDPAIRALVRDALVREGYEVHTAPNGEEALGALRAMHPAAPDAILLDMHMPVLSGWGFAAAYRRTERPPHAALIVMTAGTDAERARGEVEGAACLAKPFDLSDLYAVVERHVQSAA